MGRNWKLHSALWGALCIIAEPAVSQEGGAFWSIDFDQGVHFGDNLSLSVPAAAREVSASTDLGLNFVTRTRTQEFRFSTDLGLSFGVRDGGTANVGYDIPGASISYSRAAATSSLAFVLSGQRSNVADVLSLQTILEGGVPEDYEGIGGVGTKSTYNSSLRIVTGEGSPLTTTYSLSASRTLYEDTVSPDLFDIDKATVGVALSYAMSPSASLNGSISYTMSDADDADQTFTTSRAAAVGYSQAISEDSTLGLTFTNTRTTATTTGGSAASTANDVSLSYSGPGLAGPFEAAVSLGLAGQGGVNLELSQSKELPAGKIDYSLGADFSGATPVLVGSLSYAQQIPSGQMSLGYRRDVGSTTLGEKRLTSGAWAGFSYEVTPSSTFGLRADLLVAEATLLSGAVTEAEITANYTRALTPDWDFRAGLGFRVRDEEGVGYAASPSIELGLSRSFLLKY